VRNKRSQTGSFRWGFQLPLPPFLDVTAFSQGRFLHPPAFWWPSVRLAVVEANVIARHFSVCYDFQALPWRQEGYTMSVTHNLHLSAF